MGIFGVLSYLKKNCPDGTQGVDLSGIAAKYKDEMKKDPVMLVDISSCVPFFLNKHERKELKKLKEKLELFINKCSDIGIKLKFVAEGMKPTSKYNHWEQKLHNFFHCQDVGFWYSHFYLGVWLNAVGCIIQTSDKCEYVRSVYEADRYIMNYAREHDCFAILSNDSDFLMMDGFSYFLSIQDLDLKSMTTVNYNRFNFARSLDLNVAHLPIFAAYCGDAPCGLAYEKRVMACRKDGNFVKKEYQRIADKVRNLDVNDLEFETLNLNMAERLNFEEKLRSYGFIGEKKDVEPPNGESTGNDNWSEIIRLARTRHVTGVAERKTLEILQNKVNFLSELKPQKKKEVGTPVPWLQSLRKNIYGILFYECPGKKVAVTEYTSGKSKSVIHSVSFLRPEPWSLKTNFKWLRSGALQCKGLTCRKQSVAFRIIFCNGSQEQNFALYCADFCDLRLTMSTLKMDETSPTGNELTRSQNLDDHCGLLNLWSEDRSKKMISERRKIFCRALNENLTPEMLEKLNLPEELLFPVLALFHWLSSATNMVPAVDPRIFLLPAILANKLTAKEIEMYREPLEPSALDLCEWYITIYLHLQLLNSVCGEPYCRFKTNLLNNFDGTLYEHFYKKITNASWRGKESFGSAELMRDLQVLQGKLNDLVSGCRQVRREKVSVRESRILRG